MKKTKSRKTISAKEVAAALPVVRQIQDALNEALTVLGCPNASISSTESAILIAERAWSHLAYLSRRFCDEITSCPALARSDAGREMLRRLNPNALCREAVVILHQDHISERLRTEASAWLEAGLLPHRKAVDSINDQLRGIFQ
jgi:hypothetical protein